MAKLHEHVWFLRNLAEIAESVPETSHFVERTKMVSFSSVCLLGCQRVADAINNERVNSF